MASELATLQSIEASGTLNPVQKSRLEQLKTAGGAPGRADGVIQNAGAPTTFSDGAGAAFGAANGIGQTAIDLPSFYKSQYDSSGIANLEAAISAKERRYTEALSTINDNPFLSEGSRVGRQQKLNIDFENSTANDYKNIDRKRADIETAVGLQSRQFDINSQQSQLALSQFNSLLSSGALDSASGDDIAKITRATGLSSASIDSAIKANKAKNLTTTVQSYDDGTNQGFKILTIDQGGNIVNSKSEIVGPSAKAASNAGSFDSSSFFNSLMGQAASMNTDYLWSGVLGANTSSSSSSSSFKYTAGAPTFSPSGGVGTKYKDSKGITWMSTKTGWVRSS